MYYYFEISNFLGKILLCLMREPRGTLLDQIKPKETYFLIQWFNKIKIREVSLCWKMHLM